MQGARRVAKRFIQKRPRRFPAPLLPMRTHLAQGKDHCFQRNQNARSTLAKSGTVGATPNAQENETGRYSLIADTLPATTRQTPSFCTHVRR